MYYMNIQFFFIFISALIMTMVTLVRGEGIPSLVDITSKKNIKVEERSLKNATKVIKDNKYRQHLVTTVEHPIAAPEPVSPAEKLPPFFEWEVLYKYQQMRNFHGGTQVGNAALANLDIKSAINLDQFSWGKGLKGFVDVVGNFGNQLSQKVGDYQFSSNIDSPGMVFLYQAWVEKTVLENMFSLMMGLIEINTDFYVAPTSFLFLNSSFGLGPEFSGSGVNGSSTYPYTSLGVRAKIDLPNKVYALWAVFDGVPGDPRNLRSNGIKWQSTDGLLLVSEVGTTTPFQSAESEKAPDTFSKFGIGVWGYTQSFEPVDSESGASAQGNFGVYALYDKTTSSRFSYFIKAGYANKEVSTVMANWNLGFNYRAPFSFREEDIIGFGITDAIFSPGYRRAQERDGVEMVRSEMAFELTYRFAIWEDVAIQPNYQFITHPSGEKALANAHVGGIQFEIGM